MVAQSLQDGDRQHSRLGSLCCESSISNSSFRVLPPGACMGSHYFGPAPAPAQTAALLLSLLPFLFFFFSSSWHLPPFLKHILAEAPATLQWAVWCAAPGGFARCGALCSHRGCPADPHLPMTPASWAQYSSQWVFWIIKWITKLKLKYFKIHTHTHTLFLNWRAN